MRRYGLFAASLLLAASTPASAAVSLEPAGHTRHDPAGHLRLATHLDLVIPHTSPADLLDRLLERSPQTLPAPVGLEAHTRVLELGPVTWIQRTWSREGIPVDRLSLTVLVDRRGHVRVISAKGLGNTGGTPRPWLPEAAALTKAREHAAYLLGSSPEPLHLFRGLEATPGGLRAVWRVLLEPEPPLLPRELRLEADTGAPLGIFPRAAAHAPRTTREARGTIYRDSPLDGETWEAPLPDLTDPVHLTGLWVDVYNYTPTGGGQLVQTAVPTSSDNARYNYPPIEEYQDGLPTVETQTDLFGEVMMYHHVNAVHSYFNDLGYFNDNAYTGIDRSMSATVNYRSRAGYYDNAYYSLGSEGDYVGKMVFGQGEASDFTYDASVIYHEYGHAVVNGTSNYGLGCYDDAYGSDCTEGGLNEGTADYFSSSLRDDPGIGQYSIGEWMPEYARDLTAPNRCPDDLYGEVHEDGKIWGGALWDIRTAVAGESASSAHDRLDPLIFAAIATPLPEDATGESALSYAADILETVADAAALDGTFSQGELAALKVALDDRGLINCQRFVPLTSGRAKSGAFSATAFPLPGAVSRAGLQYVVDVPEGAYAMEFEVAGLGETTIYARRGAPVEFRSSTDIVSDLEVHGLSFRLDSGSSTRLEPGVYYITFTSKVTIASALYGYYYSVRADVELPFEPDEGSGCSCGRSEETAAAGPGLLMLVVAGALRRRRRTGSRRVLSQ